MLIITLFYTNFTGNTLQKFYEFCQCVREKTVNNIWLHFFPVLCIFRKNHESTWPELHKKERIRKEKSVDINISLKLI